MSTDQSKMTAGYKCNRCKLERFIQVRQRVETEDVVNYAHHVARICGEQHRLLSPVCCARQFDIKLPTTENGIGVPGRALTDEEIRGIRQQLKRPKA